MATLTLIHPGKTVAHEIEVMGWEPVTIEDESGTVEAVATHGNVILRFGSPDADYRAEVVLRESERHTVELAEPVYARAFEDRPVGDF